MESIEITRREPKEPETFEGQRKGWQAILSPEALRFLAALLKTVEAERKSLLRKREERQKEFDAGKLPDFLPETKDIRDSAWKARAIPRQLRDRRVEITGPVERKMIINALNSGAKVFMADFEDSLSPSWQNVMDGQLNLYQALRRQIHFENAAGKKYTLNKETALLLVRPRGLHLEEAHVLFEGSPAGAAFVDFGLHAFHNAKQSLEAGYGPYYYLPKLESHEEAGLWAKAFAFSENYLGLPQASFKATVLIETLTAVFEMHEIIHALKDYCVGLNCGRWDYIFSYIKKLASFPGRVLPDRQHVGMDQPFLENYSKLLIQTCHARGIHAMGGMAAQIPIKNNAEANEKAFEKVRNDKEREAKNGHDGTWVAHPGLIKTALEIFTKHMHGEVNQIHSPKQRSISISAKQLLAQPSGPLTRAGFENNCEAALHYLAAWLHGNGCVPLFNLMEDMATAEIARAQLWQWRTHHTTLEDGDGAKISMSQELIQNQLNALLDAQKKPDAFSVAPMAMYQQAARLLDAITQAKNFIDFIPSQAYKTLVNTA